MGFLTENKAIVAFKHLLGKSHTEAVKEVGNEAEGIFINVPAKAIFGEEINNDPAQAVIDGVAKEVIADMIPDPSSNGHAFFAVHPTLINAGAGVLTVGTKYAVITVTAVHDGETYNQGQTFVAVNGDLTSGDVKETIVNAISPSFGTGFEAKPKIGATPIPVGDPRDWIFQYQSGVFFQQDNVGSDPTTVELYVYIGKKLDAHNEETTNRTIYVETAGNDVTGDGKSVGTAFATIRRALDDIDPIINDCEITVQLGAGSFTDILSNELARLSQFFLTTRNSAVFIQGTTNTVKSGLSLTRDANDRFLLQDATGGFTPDEYRLHFLRRSSNPATMYPIAYNTTDTLEVPFGWNPPTAYDEIAEIETILNMSSGTFLHPICANGAGKIAFRYFDITIEDVCRPYGYGAFRFQFNGNILRGTTAMNTKRLIQHEDNNQRLAVQKCILIKPGDRALAYISGDVNFSSNYIYGETADNAAYGIDVEPVMVNKINDILIDNVMVGFDMTGGGIHTGAGQIKVKNSGTVFRLYTENSQFFLNNLNRLTLENTNYMFANLYCGKNIDIRIPSNLVYGSVVTATYVPSTGGTWGGRAITASAQKDNYFIDIDTNWFVFGPGDFIEIEHHLEETLTNDTSGQIIIGDIDQNLSIEIIYAMTRGSARQTGRILIVHDDTDAEDEHVSTEVPVESDLGVAFDSDINSNEIRLTYVVDDAGGDAELKYDVHRIMKI